MKKKSSGLFFLTILLGIFFIASCKKEEVDTEVLTAQDYTTAEQYFVQVFSTIHSFGIQENFNSALTVNNTCAPIEFSGDTFDFPVNGPIILMLDYGSAGCKDLDGRVRKGKLKATFNGKWSKAGSKTNVEFIDFFIDGIKLDGAITITAKNVDSYDISVVNGQCIFSPWTINYTSNLLIIQKAGASTKTVISDDVFEITGTANGNSREGKLYTSKIILPLTVKTSCNWVERGASEIIPEGLTSRIVNYGDGICDKNAIISINGNVYNFNLK